MLTLVVWAMGAALLLINILLRTRILRLEARLRALSDPKEQLSAMRQHAASKDKIAAIKAMRKQYPELSLIEANALWQQVQARHK